MATSRCADSVQTAFARVAFQSNASQNFDDDPDQAGSLLVILPFSCHSFILVHFANIGALTRRDAGVKTRFYSRSLESKNIRYMPIDRIAVYAAEETLDDSQRRSVRCARVRAILRYSEGFVVRNPSRAFIYNMAIQLNQAKVMKNGALLQDTAPYFKCRQKSLRSQTRNDL